MQKTRSVRKKEIKKYFEKKLIYMSPKKLLIEGG